MQSIQNANDICQLSRKVELGFAINIVSIAEVDTKEQVSGWYLYVPCANSVPGHGHN